MITIIKKDLLKVDADIYAHQVNIEGKMGAGVALAIRKEFPDVYSKYQKACNTVDDKYKLFECIQVIKTKRRNGREVYVANLFAQSLQPLFDNGKRCTDYESLEVCFDKLIKYAKEHNLKTIAIPYKIGSALGGGDWGVVMDIITEKFIDNKDVDLTICKL